MKTKKKINITKMKAFKISAIVVAVMLAIALNISLAYAVFFEPPLQEYIENSNIQKDEFTANEIANAINLKLLNEGSRKQFAGDCLCERSIKIVFTPKMTQNDETIYFVQDGEIYFSSRNSINITEFNGVYQHLLDTIGEQFKVSSDRYQNNNCVIIIDLIPNNNDRPVYVYSMYEVIE